MSALDERAIFAAARRLASAEERREYLDRACGDDRRLRARLDALLRVETEDDAFLTTPAAVLTPPAGEGPGAVIGPYTLVERLGEGGFAVVFRAEQAQPLRREVAVKVLRPGMDSQQVVARFEAERQALALMDHPGIAKVLDAGQLDSGRPYFVMELVRGVPVTAFCDAARLPVRERLALAVGVCHAVQHAHQKGVIHRDLKPSNVLATSHDGTPGVKVIDFGVAKALGGRLTEASLHTHAAQVVGTPLYMSPEQLALDGTDIDTRADVYALGVLLYELLSGTAPVDRERLAAAGFDELRRVVREEEPARPSTRITADVAAARRSDQRRLSRELAGELDWIVMKALEKDRDRRYPTANDLARDLQRYLADEPVEARPPSVAYRLGKLLRRHRGPAVAAGVVALALAGGLAGTAWGLVRAEQARAREGRAKETAEKRLAQIEKGFDVLVAVFREIDPFAEEKEGKTLRAILAERLDRAAAELDGESVGDPLVVAKLQGRLAGTYLGLGQPAKAERLFAKAWATLREELGYDDPISLETARALGWARLSAGQRLEAVTLFRQVVDAQERLLGGDHPDTLATLVNLGEACRLSGRAAEAVALMERARAGAEAQFPPDHPLVLAAIDQLAGAYTAGDRATAAKAIPLLEHLRRVKAKKFGDTHPETLKAVNNLGVAHLTGGKMRAALDLFEEARRTVVPKLPADHPFALTVLNNLAWQYRAFGKKAEAIALAERVREAQERTLGLRHPSTIFTLLNLALAHQADRQPERALPLLRQAAEGVEALNFAHAHGKQILREFCKCLDQLGHQEEAERWRKKGEAAGAAK